MTDKEAIKRIAEKLRRAGASIPAPELTGTIEGSVVTGLCIALALVESELDALADPMRNVQRLGQEIEQEPVALHCCGYTDASAVKWNPLNGVVQCHNCGQTYTPPQRTEQEPVAWFTQARNFVPLSEFTKEEAKLYGWNELYLRPPQRTEPIQSLQCFHCQVTIETLNDKVMHLLAERKPLTDEEAFKLVEQDNRMEKYAEAAVRLIRRTEAAHGIKE